VGLAAQWLIYRYMPDYRSDAQRPLDLIGLVLFSSGTALLSWLLEVFGEHRIDSTSAAVLLVIAISLLLAYGLHASQTAYPLLRLTLFKVRTFRISVLGGFVTRLGLGGMPFLLPLLYQVGIGLTSWESGLLMMPAAAAAMGMKLVASRVLGRFGYRKVLIVNTLLIGLTVSLFSLVGASTPLWHIVCLSLVQGFFNSLQFTSMNSMAYADIESKDSSMASTMGSSMQQLSMSFGLACGSLITGWYLGDVPQTDRLAVTSALHHAFLTLGAVTIVSSFSFWALKPHDGEAVSQGSQESGV